ncbi:MAG: PD-(D/E)XK nuclease family protein, partial [Planctomycetota bacterium]
PVERALADLLAAYRRLLGRARLADAAQAFHAVAEALEAGRLTAPQLVVLDRLPALDPAMQRLAAALQVAGAQVHEIEPSSRRAEHRPPLAEAVQALAARRPSGSAAPPPVLVVRAASEARLVAAAARWARAVSADRTAGTCAIAIPDDPRWVEVCVETLERHEIPFALEASLPLVQAPPVRALLALLGAIESGLARTAVVDALASPYLAWTGGLDAALVDRLAREAGIARGEGASGWRARLEAYAMRLRSAIERARRGGDEVRVQRLARRARQLEALQAPLLAALERLERFAARLEAERDPATALRALSSLCDAFGLAREARAGTDPYELARDGSALDAVGEVVAQLERAFAATGRLPADFAAWVAALRGALAASRYRVLAHGGADSARRVRVLGLREARGLAFGALALLGLGPGALGAEPPPGGLLAPSAQQRLGVPDAAALEREAATQLAELLGAAAGPVLLGFVASPDLEPADGVPFEAAPEIAQLLEHLPAGRIPVVRAGPEGRGIEPPGPPTVWQRLVAIGRTPAALSPETFGALRAAGGPPPQRLAGALEAALWRAGHFGPALGPYEGQLGAVSRERLARALAERILSPSVIGRHLRCPFRAFVADHLGLAPAVDPEEDRIARTVGELVHRVLERFYGVERPPQPGEAAGVWLERVRPVLRAILAEECARLEASDDPFLRAELARVGRGLGGEPERGPLAAFLHAEAHRGSGFEVAAREQPFGFELPLPDGDARLRVRGVIDRIDRRPRDGAFVVYDYKTGRARPRRSDLLEGLDAQLPLYLLAAERLLGGRGRGGPLAAAWYHLGRPWEPEPLVAVLDPERADGPRLGAQRVDRRGLCSLDALVHAVPRALAHLVAALRAGRLHPGALDPERMGCRHCEARRVCRLDARRLEQARAADEQAV